MTELNKPIELNRLISKMCKLQQENDELRRILNDKDSSKTD